MYATHYDGTQLLLKIRMNSRLLVISSNANVRVLLIKSIHTATTDYIPEFAL